MTRPIAAAALALALGGAASAARAQGSPYLPLDDAAYWYLDALAARGLFGSLSQLERPYTVAAVRAALDSAAGSPDARGLERWVAALDDVLARTVAGVVARRPDSPAACGVRALCGGASLGLSATAQSSGRRELMLADDSLGVHPAVTLRAGLSAGPVAAVVRVVGDRRLRQDPEFAGKKDRAVAGRIEDAYVSAQWKYGEAFFGRLARNWGPAALDGLSLGHYAYSYDHLFARLGSDRVRLSALVARLDDHVLSGDSVAQRYFSTHRLSVRWRGLEVGATESVVYGGMERGLEPALANPLNLYILSQYNEAEPVNVGHALDVAWRSPRGAQLAAQLLLDDFQVDDCELSCDEPPSFGLTASADGLPLGGRQRWFASYTRVSNLAYRAMNPWERYASHGVGLGRGFADYDEARLGADLLLVPGTALRVYGALRRQGEGDYRRPYPTRDEFPATPTFLSGAVTRTVRVAAAGAASVGGRLTIVGDLGVNRVGGRRAGERAGTRVEGRVTISFDPLWRREGQLAP